MKNLLIGALFSLVATNVYNSAVGMQAVVDAPLAMPAGGPQGIEGYVRLGHDRGTTRLAIGAIGNVENNAAGDTIEVRGMQSGGVVTNRGRVAHWSGLYLSTPRAGEGYTGPANIDRFDYVTFDNGWSIRPSGDTLVLCNAAGACHTL